MLTIVAAIAWGKPVFLSPPDRREEANAARKRLAADSAGNVSGAHLKHACIALAYPLLSNFTYRGVLPHKVASFLSAAAYLLHDLRSWLRTEMSCWCSCSK